MCDGVTKQLRRWLDTGLAALPTDHRLQVTAVVEHHHCAKFISGQHDGLLAKDDRCGASQAKMQPGYNLWWSA